MTTGNAHHGNNTVTGLASPSGPVTGVNYGTVQQLFFSGQYTQLKDASIALDSVPVFLGLIDPANHSDLLGMFTGRTELLRKIDEIIDNCVDKGQGKYLLIEAEAGVGKSAIAARLAFDRDRSWPAHFTFLGFNNPARTRRSLAAQLIARWNLGEQLHGGMLPETEGGTPEFLNNTLCAAAARREQTEPDKPVVLVVDGLNEAPAADPGQMPFGLPEVLPAGTVVVATTRHGLPLPYKVQRIVETIVVESAENREELLSYLRLITRRDADLKTALESDGINNESFCQALTNRSEGVWIYARNVLDQIRAGQRSGLDIDQLPLGLVEYYADSLRRWRDSLGASWPTLGLPLLGTLAAARAAMPGETLARWSGLSLNDVDGILDGLFRPFLAVDDRSLGGGPKRSYYAIRHQSFRECCEGPRPPIKELDPSLRPLARAIREATADAHQRITDDLLPSGDMHTRVWPPDGYIRAYLAEHAAPAGRLDALVQEPDFLLFVGSEAVSRLRGRLRTLDGRTAAAAAALAANSANGGDADSQRRWLEVSARKLHASNLAANVQELLSDSWYPSAAAWSGTVHRMLPGHANVVAVVAEIARPGSDHLLASAGFDGSVRLWNPEKGSAEAVLTGHTARVVTLTTVVQANGKVRLASAGYDSTVRVWDVDDASNLSVLSGHANTISALISIRRPDAGDLLASASWDNTVRLWDMDSLAEFAVLDGHTEPVVALAAVSGPGGDRMLASAGGDGTVRLWKPDATPFGVLTEGAATSPGPILALATIPRQGVGSLLVAAGHDKLVRLWDPERRVMLATGSAHTDAVVALTVIDRSDGRRLVASAGNDGSIVLWDANRMTRVATLAGHSDAVVALDVVSRPDGGSLLASAGYDSTVRLWDPDTGQEVSTLTGHSGRVEALTVVNRQQDAHLLASAGYDGTVRLWDTDTVPLVGHSGPIQALALVTGDRGRRLLASASYDHTVRLWDARTAEELGPLAGHSDAVVALATISLAGPGGSLLASGSYDGTVRLWHPETHGQFAVLEGHTDRVVEVIPLRRSDGRRLIASASRDETIRLWDVQNATEVEVLHGHSDSVTTLTTIGGSGLLASGGYDGTVRLWSPDSGEQVGLLKGHTSRVVALTALQRPDGRWLLASAGWDRTVHLWDVTSFSLVEVLSGHGDTVSALAVLTGADGRQRLASGSWDQTIRLWDLDELDKPRTLAGHTDAVQALAVVSRVGACALLASASSDGSVRLWEPGPSAGMPDITLVGHTDSVAALVATDDAGAGPALASAGYDRSIILWSESAIRTGRSGQGC